MNPFFDSTNQLRILRHMGEVSVCNTYESMTSNSFLALRRMTTVSDWN